MCEQGVGYIYIHGTPVLGDLPYSNYLVSLKLHLDDENCGCWLRVDVIVIADYPAKTFSAREGEGCGGPHANGAFRRGDGGMELRALRKVHLDGSGLPIYSAA